MSEKTFHEIELEAWTERASDYDALFAPVSRQAIDDILDSLEPLRGKRHLDVACGTGHLVAAATSRGTISEGIDFTQAMVEVARANYPTHRYQVGEAGDLPYDDGEFDAVTCAFGLNHMENPQTAVDEAYRVVKAGGRFAFTLWYGEEDGNESQRIVQEAIAAFVTTPYPLPQSWTRLRNANKEICQAITEQAGFGAPDFKRLPIMWQLNSASDLVSNVKRMSIRNKMIIDHQPPEIQQQIYDHIRLKVEAERVNGVISLAWPALLAVVRKNPDHR